MPDNNVTVDELAIKVAAESEGAAASINALAASLERLLRILTPVSSRLGALAPTLRRANAAAIASARGVGKTPAASIIPTAIASSAMPSAAAISGVGAQTAAATAAVVASGAKMGGALSSVKSKAAGFVAQLTNIGAKSKAVVASNTLLGGSFIQLRSTIFFALFAFGAITATLGRVMSDAMDFNEQMNLFAVSLGAGAEAANKWIEAMSSKMGFDPVAMRTMYSTFYLIADSLGINSTKATILSKDLTQLSYDYASLFNMNIGDVRTKLESALTGQSRAVIRLGLDVTKSAQIQQLATQGIKATYAELTKADKAILIHNIIMAHSTKAQGDFARTLNQPANLLRIVGDQFAILSRTIGYLFIPMIQATLPWLIALAQGLNTVIGSFLAMFGIKMPTWKDFTQAGKGADNLAGGMDDAAAATGKAAKAAKELLDYTLGIDELNILSPKNSGGGGSGGGGGAGGVDIPITAPYDFTKGLVDAVGSITAPVKAIFKAIGDSIRPFLDAIGRVWDALKPFAKNVWRGFTNFWKNVLLPLAAWTLNTAGVAALDALKSVLEWFNAHPKAAEGIGAALATLTAFKGAGLFISAITKVGKVLGAIFGVHFLSGLAANIATFLSFLPNAGGAIGYFFTSVGSGVGIIETLATMFGTTLTGALSAVGSAFTGLSAPIVAVIIAVTAVVAVFATFISKNWNDITSFTKRAFKTVGDIIMGVFNIIKTTVLIVVALIVTGVKKAWESLPGPVKVALTRLWETITGMFAKIKESLVGVWDGLQNGLGAVWGAIKDIFRLGANSVIRVLNVIIDAVNKVLEAAKKVDLSGILKDVPSIGRIQLMGAEPPVTQGRAMASGGMPPVGSIFLAGEAGPELMGSFGGNPNTVMPLANSGFVEAMASATYRAVASAMSNSGGSGDTGDVWLDGEIVGRVIRQGDKRRGISSGLVKVN